MTKFTIYHADPPRFGPTPKVVRVRTFPKGYQRVARLEAADPEEAYHRSQNVDAAWITRPEVTVFKSPARSTSCGDIIAGPRGQKWYVAWMGMYPLQPDRSDPKVLVGRPAVSQSPRPKKNRRSPGVRSPRTSRK